MLRIVTMGSHGVGKTTLCYQLAAYLKQHQYNVKIINETVRQCPFPINESATNNTELWIVHTQIVRELEAEAQGYDAFVADRGALDGIVYWAERNPPDENFGILETTALKWMSKYDVIFLVEPSSDTDQFAVDAVRSSSIAYRNRIRDVFRSYIEKLPQEIRDKIILLKSDDIFGDFHLPAKVDEMIKRVCSQQECLC